MIVYVGIDPGMSGAVGIVFHDNSPPSVWDTPTLMVGKKRELDARSAAERLNTLRNWSADNRLVVAIERVHSMPKQGVASSFNFGKGYGIWLGILAALQLSHELVTPQAWKKTMLNGMPKEKDSSRQRAMQLFPDVDLHLKKHHGRADALLLAEYLRRTVGASESMV